jgi:hypothetical protein
VIVHFDPRVLRIEHAAIPFTRVSRDRIEWRPAEQLRAGDLSRDRPATISARFTVIGCPVSKATSITAETPQKRAESVIAIRCVR